MKAILKILLFFILIIHFSSCKKESPVETNSQVPQPPVQINEYDLVGLEGWSIKDFKVNQSEPWRMLVNAERIITDLERSTFLTSDYGKTWFKVLTNLPVFSLEWDPNEPNIAYNSFSIQTKELGDKFKYPTFLVKSSDYGQSWIPADSMIPPYGLYIRSLGIDPKNNKNLFAGISAQPPYISGDLYYSTNSGLTWQIKNGMEKYNLGPVLDIAISSKMPQIYMIAHTGGKPLKSLDNGSSWNIINNIPQSTASKFSISSTSKAVMSISHPDLVISKDFGENFGPVNFYPINNSTIKDIKISSSDIFFCTIKRKTNDTSNVCISKDEGLTWSILGTDIDNKTLLDFDPKNNFLYVVMDGVKKGLYRYQLK